MQSSLSPPLFLEYVHPPKKTPRSISSHPSLPLPHPEPLAIYFLSLQICQFWIFHRNGITQHEVLCAWLGSLSVMFLGFTRVVADVSTASLFRAASYSTVWIYHILLFHRQRMGVWIASTFWLLRIIKGCCEQSLGGRMFLILLCKYLGVELHGHRVSLYIHFDQFLPLAKVAVIISVLQKRKQGAER